MVDCVPSGSLTAETMREARERVYRDHKYEIDAILGGDPVVWLRTFGWVIDMDDNHTAYCWPPCYALYPETLRDAVIVEVRAQHRMRKSNGNAAPDVVYWERVPA